MPQCIYCRASDPSVQFTREHVLQQGFGQFQNAPVLHDLVCHECNQSFSGTLDLSLTRESAEGLERYHWGVKEPADIAKFSFKSMDLRAQDLGEFTGARVELIAHDGSVRARPADGAAIHDLEGDDFTHFTIAEIVSGAWAQSPVDWKRGLKLFGNDETTLMLREALERQGVVLKSWRPLSLPDPSGSIEVGQTFSITSSMKRGIAKVAFNYLAFRRGGDFVRSESFDSIRQYIRYGAEPELEPIHSSFELPFRTNQPDNVKPVLHWLGLQAHENHRNLLGTVMLFGFMEHTVMLAQDFRGPWFDMPLAHLYNLKTKKASEVQPTMPRWKHSDDSAIG